MELHHMTEEERARVGLQADLVIRVISERYSISPQQVIESIRWIEQHKEFVSRMKNGGLIGVFTVLVSASLLALWEGIKTLVVHK